jgi:DNA-binding transcriptional regulator YiaG
MRPNGAIGWVRSSGLLQHRPDGSPWRMIGFTLDITDTRRAWIGYAAQEGLAAAVRKLTNGQVWVATPDGTVVDEISWWNSLNRIRDTGSGWSRLDLVHPEDVPAVRSAWTRALAARKPCTITFRLRDEYGQYEIYASHAEPVEDDRHSLLGWIGVTIVDGRPTAAANAIGNLPGALIRAARAYLDLSVNGLAELSGLSASTIRRMEDGGSGQVAADSEERLITTLQRAGVEFLVDAAGAPQVRFSQPARKEG